MNDRLNIPKTIKAGFQKREDTYSGLLAYLTYIDNKGKIAKETSWKHWKSDKIEDKEFDNVPVSGFVLNRHAGGYKSGWNFRQSYCRVWDPRGFEIEIKIDNLLYILDNCTSIKGRGLDGEFVYAWDKADLVLLPVDTDDYRNSIETINRTVKISAKDLNIGAIYETKEGTHLVYLGKVPVMVPNYKSTYYPESIYNYSFAERKKYLFCKAYDIEDLDRRSYSVLSDLKKLIHKVSDDGLTVSVCKDIEEYVLNKNWRNAKEHKLGTFSMSVDKARKVSHWKDVEFEENVRYQASYVVNDKLMYIFYFEIKQNIWQKINCLKISTVYEYTQLSDTEFQNKIYYGSYNKKTIYGLFGTHDDNIENLKNTYDVYVSKIDSTFDIMVSNEYGYKVKLSDCLSGNLI